MFAMVFDDVCGAADAVQSPVTAGASADRGAIFFLGDPLSTLDTEWDSSLRLMEAHRRRGEEATWVSFDDILIRNRTLFLGGVRVGPKDAVWLRLDPSNSVRWYETIRALCHVDAHIVNPPETVLTVHDKRSALGFSPRCSWSVFSGRQLDQAIGEMRRLAIETAVLKPPSLFGSKGVSFLPVGDEAAIRRAFDELLPLFGYVILEPYLGPGGDEPPPDTRVLMTSRRVLGVIERLIPPGGGWHEVKRGGPLTATQGRLVAEVRAFLEARGILLAGLDFIGDSLTEVNVSCPGAIPEINMFCDVVAEDLIVEDFWSVHDASPAAPAGI
ncbi:MAG: hypothetical protein M0006_09435 [Magnetospirillum sp.]|nr:hypothetical protein [Magnetospirillum sp.]